MERRQFIQQAALGAAAAGTLAACGRGGAEANGAPAIQAAPRVRWRLASSFPRSSDIIYRGAETLAERVAALTGGRFEIRPSPAGEIVPPFQVLDAVQNRTVPVGHTAGYYYTGKNPALAFETGVPFGMTARQHTAWMTVGDGLEQTRRLLADFGVVNLPAGNTGTQMGGWWRRPISGLADLRGLRMRIPGLGAEVMDRLGVAALSLPGGEIYQALERGNIDATEWIGPYDDQKLGFFRVARYYLYPGWWEPSAMLSFYVNRAEWDRLPEAYRQALTVAATEVNQRMLAEYDAKNPPALRELLAEGVEVRPFPRDVMVAAAREARGLYEEAAAADAGYRGVYDAYRAFRDAATTWFALAEQGYANFAFAQQEA
ncbi:MAG: TRAP transporter substrate-binding protein DctP [Rhodothermales bacterium]|nr:TRAP transporter substrate-binding protein DctP [Rhodothermales bacterium]